MGTTGEVLGREGVDRRMAGRFCVVVVQEVILFGTETWVMTPHMEKALEGFHHWALRRMSGMGPKRKWDETCVVIFCKFRTDPPPDSHSGSEVLRPWLGQPKRHMCYNPKTSSLSDL